MRGFIEDFKAFAIKGNVVDLAVAVVIGAAFGKIVSSLVENVIMPLMGILLGGVNFTNLAFKVSTPNPDQEAVSVAYGIFLQNIFDFLIISLAVFLAVRIISRLQKKKEEAPEVPKAPTEEIILLREIRDSLRR